MTLFEWIQTCTVEDLAEWLDAFQDQCEENIIQFLRDANIDFTQIQMAKEISIAQVIQMLNTEI